MSTSADDQVFLSALASHYDLAQCEGWHLFQQHLELASGFSFIYIQVPDEWGARLLHQHLPDILPTGSSVQRIIFDPNAPVGTLAEQLLGLPPLAPGTAVLWVAAEPQSTLSHQQVENAWHDALARLNRYRNTLQATLPCTLAIVAPASVLPLLREAAPDLWSIRSTVIRIEPRSRQATAMIFMRDDDRLKIEQAFADDSGDPASTLEAVAKLRAQPGREALLIPLLHRAGKQAALKFDWATAQSCLEEAWELANLHGTDFNEQASLANDLSLLFQDLAQHERAEFYAQRFLEIAIAHFGGNSPQLAAACNNLARLFQSINRIVEAEPLIRRALEIDEANFGKDHPKVAVSLGNLAALFQETDRPSEAEPLMRRALAMTEANFGKNHRTLAVNLNNLAGLLHDTNRFAEAEPLMRRALEIDEANFGRDHPEVARDLANLAGLLHDTNRLAEAEPLMRNALAIDERSFGEDHPEVATDLNNLALLLQDIGHVAEAETLLRRSLSINEASFGRDHPKVSTCISNLASMLEHTGQLAEAEPLLRRALAIDEASFGKDHPKVAIRLNNLAQVLQDTNRLAEAEPLSQRAVEIFMRFKKHAGHEHTHLQTAVDNYVGILLEQGLTEEAIVEKLKSLKAEVEAE